ncbi:DUF6037 family protein [Sulfurovum mangrovi]|uniref:DUF6037 family protein n=1 Tax=Sulfurovum mangrovi TaxID=2893889 RepID=UPI001E46EA5B|nr:DUF6037 family protein [Sulfurovum mangrovi]UFH58268.1 DUF6037 family protein [Sulfurovum mangrovi]
MNIFENFRVLKQDMENHGWVIEAFQFIYKNRDYIVLAKLYQKDDRKPKYALLQVEILKKNDINDNLTIPVNTNGFMTDAKTLREFFDIDYSENIGDILRQFNEYFSTFIPTQVNLAKSQELKVVMTNSLSKSDSQDPSKIYCFSIKRNPDTEKRTPFNDNKSRLLRPSLYVKFKDDHTVSFCYSSKKEKEKTDGEIINNFSNNS